MGIGYYLYLVSSGDCNELGCLPLLQLLTAAAAADPLLLLLPS